MEDPGFLLIKWGVQGWWLILDPASELQELLGSCPLQAEPRQWSLYTCSTNVTDVTMPLSDTRDSGIMTLPRGLLLIFVFSPLFILTQSI